MERQRAPVAQLDRALASGARGRGFESRRVHHFFAPDPNSKITKKIKHKAFANKNCPALCFSFFYPGNTIARVIFLRVALRFSPPTGGSDAHAPSLRSVESRRVYIFQLGLNRGEQTFSAENRWGGLYTELC